jgi:hypothetical protein
MATMVDDPYPLHVPAMTGGVWAMTGTGGNDSGR